MMNQSSKRVRAVLRIGAGLVLLLLAVSLSQYESLADSILAWIDTSLGRENRTLLGDPRPDYRSTSFETGVGAEELHEFFIGSG